MDRRGTSCPRLLFCSVPEALTAKRIVFTTWGSFGDIHPFMALALEMKRRGHDCTIVTSEIYREKIEAEGIGFHPVRPDLPGPESEEAATMIRRLLDSPDGPGILFREVLNPHFRETYADTLAAVEAKGGADMLVSHQVPLAAPLVAAKTGVKWVSCALAPIAFCSAYDPPVPPQFPLLYDIAALHPLIAKTLFEVGKWTTASWVKPVHQLREELGLGRGPNPIFDGQHSPVRVLALFSKVLSDVQPDFPPNTLITGFPFYDRRDAEPPTAELMSFLNAGDPPIVFTLGSSLVWVGEQFFRVSVEAAKRLGRRAVLLIGDKRNLPTEPLPDTIAALEYAPRSLVMPRASVIVHQCGIGTTGQALRSGRPMLTVPYGQDQPDNAHRCVRLGVARTITPDAYKVDRVVSELSRLIDDPAYAAKAAMVAEKIDGEHGTNTACDAIEQVMRIDARKT